MRKTVPSLLLALGLAATSAVLPAQASGTRQLYSFPGGNDVKMPVGQLVKFGGLLYGVSFEGGGYETCFQPNGKGCGTLFAYNPQTGKETVLHRFQGAPDAAQPLAGLTRIGNLFYGTTCHGGVKDQGTLYTLDPTSGTYQVVHSFSGGEGGHCPAAAVTGVAGMVYGTTLDGGNEGCGTIFAFDPATGKEKSLYLFSQSTTGCEAQTRMIQIGDRLWGTTSGGGGNNSGVIFSINPITQDYKVVHAFQQTEGFDATGDLLRVGQILYGTLRNNSTYTGVLYAFDRMSDSLNIVYTFKGGADAYAPTGPLLYDGGKLYGTTTFGGTCPEGRQSHAVLYSVDLETSSENVLHVFCGPRNPAVEALSHTIYFGGLYQNGARLYGLGGDAGTDNAGYIFEYLP